MKPVMMNEVIEGKRYRTDLSTLLAHNAYWDGHNYERRGTNLFLYKTANGNYFLQHQSCNMGERHDIKPIEEWMARSQYEFLPVKVVTFEQAFPNAIVLEA
jgi:hypothetical protein